MHFLQFNILSDTEVARCKCGVLSFDIILFYLDFRVFSRIVVVPFNRIDVDQSLENSLNLQMELRPFLETAVRSIGIILKMGDALTTMRTDPVFQEVLAMSESFDGLDLRARFNYMYVLLMFSTGKVCSRSPVN